jgi:hypothetical protein
VGGGIETSRLQVIFRNELETLVHSGRWPAIKWTLCPLPILCVCMYLYLRQCMCVCKCAQACTVRAYPESEREPRCTRACARRMCMGHKHVHADGHSGHVLVECVRADCLLVSCPGACTCTTTRSACCRRASLTGSRRLGE